MNRRRINVLHVRDSGGLYGAEQVILGLGRRIDKARFGFSLICLDRGDGKSEMLGRRARKLGIQVTMIPDKRGLDLGAISAIKDYIHREGVDICHSHDMKSNLYSLFAARRSKVILVTTAHGSTRDSLKKRLSLFVDENLVYRRFHKIIAVSREIRRKLIRSGIDSGSIAVIQNGIDKDLIDLFSEEGASDSRMEIPRKGKLIGIIGRLYPDKGHRFFLEAFSNVIRLYPDTKCIVVGDGPERTGLQKRIRESGLEDAVMLCGARSNMKEVYNVIDFLVIPSKREGLPFTVLEAMIRKIPVVSTKVGDIPLLIQDDISGSLVEFGDINGMTGAMNNVIGNFQKYKQMAEVAYGTVMRDYTADKMVYMTEQTYCGLLWNAQNQG